MQKIKTGVNDADPAENQTPSYSAEVELEGNEANAGHIHALLWKLCLPRDTKLAAYISTSPFASM